MPGKLIPGTPSIGKGTNKPCQWIELSTSSALETARRTFCPSFRRRSGAGTVPLTPIAGVGLPSTGSVKLLMVSAMSVPLSAGSGLTIPPETGCAQAGI